MEVNKALSFKEQRIRKITRLYYSKPEIQKVIFDFSKNREICPKYFEGFGKRPDTLQYPGDVYELVKKGATSFHCSEEIWKDPLKIFTGMNNKQVSELREGWDILIDIDSKYIEYSKICAKVIIDFLRFHNIENIKIKFSGSKGFHIIIPWKAIPKEINGIKTKDQFPEIPRIIMSYIIEKINSQLINKISELEKQNKYIKDFEVSKKVMPDLILVSPRHLFRMPYSLHEKTALASIVLDPSHILDFDLKDADPFKVKIENFMPKVRESEAKELVLQALDWFKEKYPSEIKEKEILKDFKPIKLKNLLNENFPPCIKNILNGINDGKKRALFVLINLFRSLGMDKEEIEKRIYEWNKKNNPNLNIGYVKNQISWSYKRKSLMPPNCKEFYQGIGVCIPDDFCKKIKNPVNYTIKKNFRKNKK
jgi:DNA primase catalytic subunit